MYKSSYYNMLMNKNTDGFEVKNIRTGSVIQIDSAAEEFVNTLINAKPINAEKISTETLQILLDNGFIIQDDVNELSIVNTIFERSRIGSKALGIGIAPTLCCNFACTYCYQSAPGGQTLMKQEIIDGIIKYVERNITGKEILNIDWFGGEALLAVKQIESISNRLQRICDRNGVKLQGAITTNGFLLTKANAQVLSAAGINDIQITLDGPPDIHDARRLLRNGGKTFNTIFSNIVENTSAFSRLIVRINIDQFNYQHVDELLELLACIKERIIIALRPTTSPLSPDQDYDKALPLSEFQAIENTIVDLCIQQGFKLVFGYTLPCTTYCSAYQLNSFMVDPYGDVHLCPVYLGRREKRYGYLGPDGELTNTSSPQKKWTVYNPCLDEKCSLCKVLPICMGGCLWFLNDTHKENEYRRCALKYNLFKRLEYDAYVNKVIQEIT